MVKNVALGYGTFDLANELVFTDVQVELLDNLDAVVVVSHVPAGSTSTVIEVPDGLGWKVRCMNRDQHTNFIGNAAMSIPFDVDSGGGTTPVEIVMSVEVS